MNDLDQMILKDMMRRWTAGKPVCLNHHKRGEGRYAPLIYSTKHHIPAYQVEAIIRQWITEGVVVKGVTHRKHGLRPSRSVLYGCTKATTEEAKSDKTSTSANLRQTAPINNVSA